MIEKNQFWESIWNNLEEIRAYRSATGKTHFSPQVQEALDAFFQAFDGQSSQSFLGKAGALILEEWEKPELAESKADIQKILDKQTLTAEDLLSIFFPEYAFEGKDVRNQEINLRKRRTINVHSKSDNPIEKADKELVFTSNVLLTLAPDALKNNLSEELQQRHKVVEGEQQKYWFDHPILMGIEREANEMIYGLKGLAESYAYEKKAGHAEASGKLTVFLSLSVTHDGLKSLAHDYLSEELSGSTGLDDLDVYLFSEEDTEALAALLARVSGIKTGDISHVFGVDGRYGRHYSFLKAVVPLWSLVVNPEVKGTFKIDLDQVFPQKELKEQSGKTAFEHFQSDLWGARGTDWKGREVELGMIAGALVNEKDIAQSLFTPDVPLPDFPISQLKGESRIFHKQHPMAVSTLAEMMTRYGEEAMPDGTEQCLSRVHVTGGTNGILCDTLRKKRPFTPTFIGRAEDQAYLMSVLFDKEGAIMRYVHEPGLIMRHDKDAFAGASIAAAKMGTWVADLLRILYFSFYSEILPGGIEAVKEELDPFTGCFITKMPFTKIFLRLILKLLESPEDSQELLELAELQLTAFVDKIETPQTVKEAWLKERRSWNDYYDALDLIEKGLDQEKDEIIMVSALLKERMLQCRIS